MSNVQQKSKSKSVKAEAPKEVSKVEKEVKVEKKEKVKSASKTEKSEKEVSKSEKSKEKKEKPKAEKVEKKKASEKSDSALVSQLAATESEVEQLKSRRPLTNEELEKNFDELSKNLDDLLQTVRDDKNHTVGVRALRTLCRQVKGLKADCFRLLTRKVRKTTTRNGNSGFMKPVKITSEMAKFCDFKPDQLVSRVDVTKAICNYVKEKKLQNEADRRQFVPDEKLATLLGVKETITYYTLQKHIQKHFTKSA